MSGMNEYLVLTKKCSEMEINIIMRRIELNIVAITGKLDNHQVRFRLMMGMI